MILQKLLYRKQLYMLFLLVCSSYAIYAYYDIVLDSNIPFKIKAEAIILDRDKDYYLTNYLDWHQSLKVPESSTVAIRYSKNRSWMPNSLGKLSFNDEWEFKIHPSIQVPDDVGNPFLPYARLQKQRDGEFHFFAGNEIVSYQSINKGILFNFPAGGVADRVKLRLGEIHQKNVLYIDDDGLGISYTLPDTSVTVEILFNTEEKHEPGQTNFVYHFDDLAPDIKGKFVVQIDPLSLITYRYKIYDQDQRLISGKKASGKDYFQIGSVLFSIDVNYKYGALTILLFGVQLVLLIGTALFFISCLGKKSENPIQESLLATRILFNCFLLLGLPLFMITFGNYTNSISYDVALFGLPHILNLSYFFTYLWKRKRSWDKNLDLSSISSRLFINNKYFHLVALILALVVTPLALALGGIVSNERVLGLIPTLHFQKVMIIAGYILFTSENFQKSVKEYFPVQHLFKNISSIHFTNLLTLLFSLTLSLATGDFGSFLFVVIAISVIEVIRGSISIWLVLGGYIALLTGLAFLVSFDIGLSHRKLYRLVYSFTSPFNQIYDGFNQADRESLTYLWFNLKNMVETHPFGVFGDLKILDVSKSVAHSDFAFHWSTMIGGIWFWGLCQIGLILLSTHLIFILKATIFPMKASGNSMLAISNKRLTIILSFWLAITIIQICYQVFSNFMVPGVVLSGIPMPFISVGRGDFFFTIILIVGLELIFYSRSYIERVQQELQIGYSYRYFKSSFTNSVVLIGVIFALTGLKIYQVKNGPSTAGILPAHNQKEKVANLFSGKNQLINQARFLIGGNDMTNLPLSIKKQIKPLQFHYYTNEHQSTAKQVTFQTTQVNVANNVRWSSHYNFDEQIVSGPGHPYGIIKRERFLRNDQIKYFLSNDLYRHLDYSNLMLNRDLSAQINQELHRWVEMYLPADSKVSLLIFDNSSGEYLVQSQFPNTNQKLFEESFYVGSVKKAILLDAALTVYPEKYSDFEVNGLDIKDWIKFSDNEFAKQLLRDILNRVSNSSGFEKYLRNSYSMDFWSKDGIRYSDRPLEEVVDYGLLAIGGLQPHSLVDVVTWYTKLANKAQFDLKLQEIMNAPLTPGGTAEVIGEKISELGLNTKDYIAKTGTLELEGANISSTMVIANKDITIGVMMISDRLPSNNSGKTSKYLLSELLPLIYSDGLLGE